MLGVGYKFPEFSVTATVSTDKEEAFETISDQDYAGKCKVYFFWPKDSTIVCPSEIANLKDLPFPMLADIKRELCIALGILDPNDGVAQRTTFIVDPEKVIRLVSVDDFSVGRNVNEVLRVLDALGTDELCPCNWIRGEKTLSAA